MAKPQPDLQSKIVRHRAQREEMKKLQNKKRRRSARSAHPQEKKKGVVVSFHETLKHIHRDFTQLFLDKKDPTDPRLMHRIALNVQHLYFDAKQLKKSKRYHTEAEHILQALTTPWGAPFVVEATLLEAAENLDAQNPKYSDMHKWLVGISKYGHHFPAQILSMVS